MPGEWIYHTGFEDGDVGPVFPPDADQTPVVVTTTPNSGARCLSIPYESNDLYSHSPATLFTADSAAVSRSVGLSLQVPDLNHIDTQIVVTGFHPGSSNGTMYAGFRLRPNGMIEYGYGVNAVTSASFTVLGTLPGVFVAAEWIDLEVLAIIDNAAGGWAFGVNGVKVYEQFGLDTWLTNGAPTTEFALYCVFDQLFSVSGDILIDDVRIGQQFPDLQGRQHHEWIPPASTIEADGTGSAVGDHHTLLNDLPFDGADYVDLLLAGDRERFGHAGRVSTGQVSSVAVTAQALQSAGESTANLLLQSNSVETDGADIPLSASAAVYRQFVTNNPDTAAPFTNAELDAVTFGFERTV